MVKIGSLPKAGNQALRVLDVKPGLTGRVKMRAGMDTVVAGGKIGISASDRSKLRKTWDWVCRRDGRAYIEETLSNLGISNETIDLDVLQDRLELSMPEIMLRRGEAKTAGNVLGAIVGRLGEEKDVFPVLDKFFVIDAAQKYRRDDAACAEIINWGAMQLFGENWTQRRDFIWQAVDYLQGGLGLVLNAAKLWHDSPLTQGLFAGFLTWGVKPHGIPCQREVHDWTQDMLDAAIATALANVFGRDPVAAMKEKGWEDMEQLAVFFCGFSRSYLPEYFNISSIGEAYFREKLQQSGYPDAYSAVWESYVRDYLYAHWGDYHPSLSLKRLKRPEAGG